MIGGVQGARPRVRRIECDGRVRDELLYGAKDELMGSSDGGAAWPGADAALAAPRRRRGTPQRRFYEEAFRAGGALRRRGATFGSSGVGPRVEGGAARERRGQCLNQIAAHLLPRPDSRLTAQAQELPETVSAALRWNERTRCHPLRPAGNMHDMRSRFCGRARSIPDRGLFGSDHSRFVDNSTWAEPVRFHPAEAVRKPAAKKPPGYRHHRKPPQEAVTSRTANKWS